MRFHKNVPTENREFLTEQLKKYETEMAMTSEERRELHKWVASGRSPYDNGNYICDDGGWPMDFLSAMRFEQEQMEWYQSLSEEEKEAIISETVAYNSELDEPALIASKLCGLDSDEELPFQ
jgi:hypothetical protein